MIKKRKEIQVELVDLENCEEIIGLTVEQMERKIWLLCENLKYLDLEETYWYERSHETWLLKGDNNTSFFHRCANGRKRKNTIISLEDGDQIIEGDDKLLEHATKYYSELFGPGLDFNIQTDSNIWAGANMITEEDNDILCQSFTEREIHNALFQMESNKAAGPDKIPIEFYQSCWETIKGDIMKLFDDFYHGKVDISRLNYGIITLLPKVKVANKIQQYRPICLLNCLYKLITKTLTIRLESVADKIIHGNQTTFMKGRNIMTGILCLHEILHEILKLDFEKAYDKVNWKLLFECMEKRGFNQKWCSWIKQVVTGVQ